MKLNSYLSLGRCLRAFVLVASCCGLAISASAQQIQWGLTITNINNPSQTTVVTNGDGSIAITTAGGDTYLNPDSFAYAYQQITGDFDIRVRVMGVQLHDTNFLSDEDSAKGSLMVRESLDPDSFDFMINACPTNTDRNGQIETIGRINKTTDTDDVPGRNFNYGTYHGTSATGNAWNPVYGGDTTDYGFASYPDCWLRIRRQGNMFYSYFASTNTEEYPQNSNPLSTNGWQLLGMVPASTDFGPTVYVGLSTVAHASPPGSQNYNPVEFTNAFVTSTYQSYGPTPLYNGSASIPTTNGVPVGAANGPGAFPTTVTAVNWDVSIPADGNGYPGNTQQSNQVSPSQIVWNTGGYASVSRDIIASIDGESALGFAAARYQCSGFDFAIGPNNPTLAQNNLGPYTNPSRDRYSSGDQTVPACQSWVPSPNYGFAFPTISKNQGSWNDQSGSFWAAAYMQLDPSSSSDAFDMIGGQFTTGQAYTRCTKLVTGTSLTNGADSSGPIERAAINHNIVYFPYSQGWRAGYFDDVLFSEGLGGGAGGFSPSAGVPMWKHGDGWGLYSGNALDGCAPGTLFTNYDSPQQMLTWVDATNGVEDGLAFLHLPGVNAQTDGLLFTTGDDEAAGERGPSANNAASTDGSGWWVAVRDIQTSIASPTTYATDANSDAGSSFSFIYIPWTSVNLIAGHISGTNGSVIKSAGNFTVTRTSTGHYQLNIPGKTGASGVLMLQNSGYLPTQPSGFSNVVDNSFMSYEYGGTNNPNNVFMINAVSIKADDSAVQFADADFNFVWVDYTNPLAPPGSAVTPTQPTLSITRNAGNVVISWTGSAGTLQSATALGSPTTWTTVGTINPATVPITGGAQFFRVSSGQ